MPKELERKDGLILYKSMLAGGPDLVVAGLTRGLAYNIFSSAKKVSHLAPVDSLSAEAFGTDLPRWCQACKACKECQFKTKLLTTKENAEYEVIISNFPSPLLSRFRVLNKAARVLALVIAALAKWKGYSTVQ